MAIRATEFSGDRMKIRRRDVISLLCVATAENIRLNILLLGSPSKRDSAFLEAPFPATFRAKILAGSSRYQ